MPDATPLSEALRYSHALHAITETVHPVVVWFRGTLLGKIVYNTYVAVMIYPLQQLYIRGFWNSRPMADICAQLTSHRSEFWLNNPAECAVVIENNFDAWLVYTQFGMYVAVVIMTVRCLLRRLCP